MSLPTTKDVSKVIDFLKRGKSSMPAKKKGAITLRQTGKSKFNKKKKVKAKSGHRSQWF